MGLAPAPAPAAPAVPPPLAPNLHFAAGGTAHGTNVDEDPQRYAKVGPVDHASPLGNQNPTCHGCRRQIANAGNTISQPQIARCSNGSAHRMLNLPNLIAATQDHHDLDVALARGGTHPCLHKLATARPTPDPKVITLINSKLKGVSEKMTREQLVEHCRVVIEKQRPSSTVNEVRVNGAMAGRQGDNMIVHEHVMRMMLHAKQPLHQSDIGVLRDFAQTRNQHKGSRVLSKTHNGPGKFMFP